MPQDIQLLPFNSDEGCEEREESRDEFDVHASAGFLPESPHSFHGLRGRPSGRGRTRKAVGSIPSTALRCCHYLIRWLNRGQRDAKLSTHIDFGKVTAGPSGGWGGGGWGGDDGSKELESLDFDPVNNNFLVDQHRHLPQTLKGIGYHALTSKFLYRWVFTVVIGGGVAVAAHIVQTIILIIINTRNDLLQHYIDNGVSASHSFVMFSGYNAALVLMAAILVIILEPTASCDGIAEVKAYLNGSHVVHCFSLRPMFIRFVGTILSSAAALASGPEGPLIHLGAGIAYAVTRADKLQALVPFISPSILASFHNDRDRRDFICAGAGAGIAAAFGAPVGGVLFALEEAASHWTPQLMWRVFTAALVATFTLALIKAGYNRGDVSLAGLLSFGNSQSLGDAQMRLVNPDGTVTQSALDAPIYYWEIVFFVGLGTVGGVLGGAFNAAYSMLYTIRPSRGFFKLLEVLAVSLLTSYLVFSLALAFPRCRSHGSWTCMAADNWGEWCGGPADNSTCLPLNRATCVEASGWVCVGGENNGLACRGKGDCEWRGGKCHPLAFHEQFGVRLRCGAGEYDELGTLLFGAKEGSIARMVTQAHPHEPFSNASLLAACAVQLLLMTLTYGTSLPCGFFMPCWLIGASFGRLFGQLVKHHVIGGGSVFSGAYALAGAAAMLGGVQRASISLVFIMVEGSANVHFLLPIVTTTLVAGAVGRCFTREGIFDFVIRHRSLRFLPHDPNWLMTLCSARDVMAQPVVSLRAVERIGTIVDALRSCSHHGFPVLSLDGSELSRPMRRNRSRTALGRDDSASALSSMRSLPGSHSPQARSPSPALHRWQGSRNPSVSGGDSAFVADRPEVGGRLEGVVMRSHLRHLIGARFLRDRNPREQSLWHKVTAESPAEVQLDGEQDMYELIQHRRRQAEANDDKEWEWGMFCAEDRSRYVNLAAYMNAACYSVHESCPLSKAYLLFRKMGLRHLPVVDQANRPVGMLTRASFSQLRLHRALRANYSEEMLLDEDGARRGPRLHANRLLADQQEKGGGGGAVPGWQQRLAETLNKI